MTPDYYGLATHCLSNDHIRLTFLADAGPRIVRLFVGDSDENLLADSPRMKWPTPYGEYRVYGGHRLWHAPEVMPRSYIPDNEGLIVETSADGVRLYHPAEPVTGISKSIEVRLHPDQARVTLIHRLTNEGLWPIECAPWAITQLRPGGVAILPQTTGPLDADGLQPNRHVALWPYARWSDPRLQLEDDLILVRAEAGATPLKIGYLNRCGWIGYLRGGILFLKRFEPHIQQPHPDFNSNVEVYCNDTCIELETLAAIQRLEPAQFAIHVETWEVITDINVPATLNDLRRLQSIVDERGL